MFSFRNRVSGLVGNNFPKGLFDEITIFIADSLGISMLGRNTTEYLPQVRLPAHSGRLYILELLYRLRIVKRIEKLIRASIFGQ